MAVSETPTELFKRALAQSTRALAGETDLEVVFGTLGPTFAGRKILLPHPSRPLTGAEAERLRGYADGFALWKVHHDEAIHARYRPSGYRARVLFDAVEQMRCHALGANALKGVSNNLTAALAADLAAKGEQLLRDTRAAVMTTALALIVRQRLTGQGPPEVAADLMTHWREELESQAAGTLDRLAAAANDQEQFARVVHDLVRHLDLGHELGPAGDRRPAKATRDRDRRDPHRAGQRATEQPRMTAETLLIESHRAPELLADQVPPGQQVDDDDARGPGAAPAADRPPGPRVRTEPGDPNVHYRVFTRAHDEVVPADQLCGGEELTRLRAALDQQSRPLHAAMARLANRLQRLLLAQQKRRWRFDLEEGALDATRLPRLIVDPLAALSFKEEEDSEFKDSVVTLLIDNSGSMRGRPIMVAALCADILARTLERCGVKVEILGFTTRTWKGGTSKQDWLQAGRPAQPGRLNDLRYIVYKPADVPWRRARLNLGVMMREDILKENIDGEALLWAHDRLIRRDERRRVLMMISDGVPLDESTLSANPGGYLEQHLRTVVKWIETRSPVELLAIGIGHDATQYYQRAVAIADVDALGHAMTRQLADLFGERRDGLVRIRQKEPQS
jgi:cobaltochelatase CobT